MAQRGAAGPDDEEEKGTVAGSPGTLTRGGDGGDNGAAGDASRPTPRREAFRGSLNSARSLVAVVSSIVNGKKDQHAHIIANVNGLRISVENQAKSLHAVAYFKPSMFATYEYFGRADGTRESGVLAASKSQSHASSATASQATEDTCFRINLASLHDCLTVFGASELDATSLHVAYLNESCTLTLLLEEGGILTECEIRTIPPGDEIDFPGIFRETPTINKAWIKSEHLREAFTELADLPGAATVTVYMAPRAPHLRLSAVGNSGSCTVDFPKGSESFLSFDSDKEQFFHYHLSLLQFAVRGLSKAEETFVRINELGMLNLNHKVVQASDGEVAYVSFILIPDEAEPMTDSEADDRDVGADVRRSDSLPPTSPADIDLGGRRARAPHRQRAGAGGAGAGSGAGSRAAHTASGAASDNNWRHPTHHRGSQPSVVSTPASRD